MPTEGVWVALITAASLTVGFFLRPIGDFIGETLRGRRERSAKRETFQYETLLELQKNLEVLRAGNAFEPGTRTKALARVESLAFAVRDDRLRELLEVATSKPLGSDEWKAAYGDAVRRLGEVLRQM
jgi:hypothetical protein